MCLIIKPNAKAKAKAEKFASLHVLICKTDYIFDFYQRGRFVDQETFCPETLCPGTICRWWAGWPDGMVGFCQARHIVPVWRGHFVPVFFKGYFGNICQLWVNFWQLLASFGNFWQLLATFGYCWQLLAAFGYLWQLLADFGYFWQHLATIGSFWQLLATFG